MATHTTMRILFIVPYTPNRIRTRPFHLIRGLTGHGHEVTVLTVTENAAEEADARSLDAHCARVITAPLARWRAALNCLLALPSGAPLQSAYSWQPALMQQLQHLTNGHGDVAPFDVIHVEHLRGVRYGLALKSAKGAVGAAGAAGEANGASPPIVWDSVDCISHLFSQAATHSRSSFGRVVTRLELSRTRQYEAKLPSIFDRTLVTSDADRRALLALSSRQTQAGPIHVLPNGVDLDYFTPGPASEEEAQTTATGDCLVVSGKMSYHANVTMVLRLMREIMPRVWAHQPHVQLCIVGKDPTTAIQELAQHDNVTVTGTVPDIRPYLRRATIAVAPLTYGAGIQNKVLEAMACGAPVVASPQAAAALDAQPDRDLLLAGDDEAFAAAILDLLAHPDRRRQLAANGRTYVEAHHSWTSITARLIEIYADAAHTRCSGERVGLNG